MKTPTVQEYQQKIHDLLESLEFVGKEFWTPGEGHLFTREDWLKSVANQTFISGDGFGYLARANANGTFQYLQLDIYPSLITKWKVELPEWVTHVIWFNK